MTKIYTGLYDYVPSQWLPILCVVAFLGLSLLHTYQLLRTQTWHMLPMVAGCYGTPTYLTQLHS